MENFNIGGPKKQIRPNKTQVRMLVEYMREHPDFAAAKFTTANGLAQMQRQWETLATLLNEHGPARNAQQWKVTWRDQKSRARKEGSAHNCAMRATGNGPVPELSDNSALVLDTIGKETAVGAGRPESGIGFKLPVSAEGPPNKYEAGPTGSQKLSTAPQASAAPEKAGPAEMTKRKRKTQPPAQFLGAQIEANHIQETQLQSVNKSLAGINATLQLIYQSLETSNRLRKLQLQAAGHVLDEASMDEEEYEYEELELDSE